MKEIFIDAALLCDRSEIHCRLREALGCENYIGNNLDALHDALTTIAEDTKIRLCNLYLTQKQLGGYARNIAEVFAAASMNNPHLTVLFETIK